MKVLALTHAHLNPDGLSPVSCERADSITGTWAEKLNWDVDVIHTKNTKWRGIWPEGKGLKINIIDEESPQNFMMGEPQLFSTVLKKHLTKGKIKDAFTLVSNRITKRTRISLAARGLVLPYELAIGEKWGQYLLTTNSLNSKKYDFIFACVGYGDEYLLQTALVLSKQLNIPMVVDFRDLWSEHHEPHRFTAEQRALIRKHEIKLLKNTVLISVPQKHMKALLERWTNIPVYLLSHSAYVGKDWADGKVVNNEFRMLYAGKLYAQGPGLKMLLEFIKKLSAAKLDIPFKCYFFVDDTATLKKIVSSYGIADFISVNEWVSPSALWGNLRSAHLLLIPDSGVAEHFPIIPTKAFQYAYTGQQILCLLEYKNDEMQEFLDEYDAGLASTNIDEAVKWTKELAQEQTQYNSLPPLRNIPLRENLAMQFGEYIEKAIVKK